MLGCTRSTHLGPRAYARRRPAAAIALLATALPVLAARSHVVEPPAADALTLDQVLANVRQATGYDAFARSTGVQLKGTGELAGMPVTHSLILDANGRFVQDIRGPVSTTTAFDGHTAWNIDIGGEIRTQELGDRAQTLLAATIMSGRWLAPDSALAFTLDEPAQRPAQRANSPDGPAPITLHFRHLGAAEHGTLEIDPATWLPRVWTYSGGNATSTIRLTGLIEHAGARFPAHVERTTSNGSAVITDFTSAEAPPVFIRSPFEKPAAGPADTHFDAALPPAVEIKKAPTGHLLVHPLINGQDLGWFIFDTGAGANVLAKRVVDQLKLNSIGELPAVGVGGAVKSSLVRPASLALGPMTIDNPLVVVMDLSFLDAPMGTPIAGLVGYGLLARAVVELDMTAPALALHDPAAHDDAGLAWRPLHLDQRVPCIEARFEDHDGVFRIDSGAAPDTITFHAPAVSQFNLLDNRETSPAMVGGVGGALPARSGTLAWFEVAGLRHDNVKATFATEPKGAFGDPYITGNMGGQLLKPVRLVLDYQKNRIAFVPR